ncbi:hypothetical protein DNK57_01350 [Methanothermobacter thermautotrophicus]|jgi:hypothetical protein|uniref:Uncharacterized protein n=1 Tax=Methanothermobacter thermautotrophicus TaxID=145262 RepID=A0A842YKV7_METTF|nr:hypothetical protein [Methanothermobacter thermautotrophicus]MBE2899478.1 hypothetical protein [Methanothermobacter thermautotrophicus]MCQ8904641.1 hypothetical protein [Methanothermobacter sp.]
MSGVKVSPLEFVMEMEARQKLLSSIYNSMTRIEGLKKKLLEIMSEIPEGPWRRSPKIAEINSWVREPLNVHASSAMNSRELRKIENSLRNAEKMAEDMLKTVVDLKFKVINENRLMARLKSIDAEFKGAGDLLGKWKSSDSDKFMEKMGDVLDAVKRGDFTVAENRVASLENELKGLIQEAESMSKEAELMAELERIDAEFKGAGDLLGKWKSSDSDKFMEKMGDVLDAVKRGDLGVAENRVAGLEDELKGLIEEAEKLESSDRMRRHVLSSVKEVAKRMGWKEVSEAYLEDDKDPASPLIYELKSYSAGKMRFSLTMDKIEVDSPFSGEDGACYEQFDSFSEKLAEYGIKTKFEGEGRVHRKPILKEKKARNLPKNQVRRI